MHEQEALYKDMYMALFHSITAALEAIDTQNFGRAKEILQKGQQEAEEIYIEAGE